MFLAISSFQVLGWNFATNVWILEVDDAKILDLKYKHLFQSCVLVLF